MTDRWSDDDELLAELGAAVRAAEAVPPELVAFGKAAYVWRTIDAELAALAYDSVTELEEEPAVVRTESAPLRALRFEAASVAVTLQIADDALVGQILPPQRGQISLTALSGTTVETLADELGYFSFSPVPRGTSRLSCQCADAPQLVTSWFEI